MSLEPVAAGELAAVVTYLDSHRPPSALPPQSHMTLHLLEHPELEEYRRLFRLVGERWLWFSRLIMPDEELCSIIRDPGVQIYSVLGAAGAEAGMLELDFRSANECELAFVGLVPELAGQGHGRWLLAQALRLAWRPDVRRVHVHTCSLDHPAALGAYIRAGFRPYKRAVERFADPRLLGILPRDCAPQIPLFGTDASAWPPLAS